MLRRLRQTTALLVVGLLLASCGAAPSDPPMRAAAAPSTAVPEPTQLSAPTSAPNPTSTTEASRSIDAIELQIHDMRPKTLVVGSDGTITLIEGDRSERVTLGPTAFADLQKLIEANNFLSLQAKYPGSECCDFIAHTIAVVTPQQRHTVYCYNECPAAFDTIKDAILRLWPHEIQYQGWA
jgi:hypothetical protein